MLLDSAEREQSHPLRTILHASASIDFRKNAERDE